MNFPKLPFNIKSSIQWLHKETCFDVWKIEAHLCCWKPPLLPPIKQTDVEEGGGGEGGWMGGWGCFESMERTKEGEGEKKYLRRWKDSQEKDRNLSVMMVMMMMMMMMTMMITMMMMVLMVMIVIMMIACPKWESHHRLPGFFCNF